MALADLIPEITAFHQAQQIERDKGTRQLQQVGMLQGILARQQQQQMAQQEAQEQAQMRGVVQQAGGDPKIAIQKLIATGHPKAIELATKMQASFVKPDAQMEQARTLQTERMEQARTLQTERLQQQAELARQRSEDKALSDAERNQARMDMIRLTASLRPPRAEPAPRNLQLTTDEKGNQLIVNSDGTTRPLTAEGGGGVKKTVAADKPMTEFQGKAALYGTRSAQSDKVLKALEDKISTAGLAAGQATGMIGNALMSSEQQRVNQAQRDFVNAVLRQESGAVISDAEFENAKRQYFPTTGDSPQVRAQKRANRATAIQGFKRMSGPKGSVDIDAIINEPLLPGVPDISPTPKQAGVGATGGWKVTPVPK